MPARPLDAAELEAIDRHIRERGVTRCDRGLPHQTAQQRLDALWTEMLRGEMSAPALPVPARMLGWHAAYLGGLTLAAVAVQAGRTTTAIWAAFDKYGLPRRSRSGRAAA